MGPPTADGLCMQQSKEPPVLTVPPRPHKHLFARKHFDGRNLFMFSLKKQTNVVFRSGLNLHISHLLNGRPEKSVQHLSHPDVKSHI